MALHMPSIMLFIKRVPKEGELYYYSLSEK